MKNYSLKISKIELNNLKSNRLACSVLSNIFSLLIICSISFSVFSQKTTDKLKKEQERLEKSISKTKTLLEKTKINTDATLNELKLIDQQVKAREELLLNFDNQIRSAELKIEQKNNQIVELEEKLNKLSLQYKKLIIYAYKKRSKEGKMMYIFSSNSYYEAIKRKKYLEKIAEIQRKQKLIILQHKKLIANEKEQLISEKRYKENLANDKRIEKQEILKDKEVQSKSLIQLKNQEGKLLAQIEKDEIQKQQVRKKIDTEIAKELAIIEKKKKKPTNKPEKPTGTKKSSDSPNTKEPDKETITLEETKEYELNSSFESNKGRLPWPVSTGTITESYGKNPHPTIKNVFTNNNGIDISANKGAQVRAVFEGEVSSVFAIPGAGRVVIIKHGNYRTVYSNLQEAYVSVGSKVSTKQAIGSLIVKEDESLSVAHFEIHQVVGSQVNRMNPSLWISR
jgi:murein hydrolase activator